LERYTDTRARNFKEELAGLGPTEDRKAVEGAYERANRSALRSVGVSVSEPKPRRAQRQPARAVAVSDEESGTTVAAARVPTPRRPTVSRLSRATRLRRLRPVRVRLGRLRRGRLRGLRGLRQPRIGRRRRLSRLT